MSLFFQLHYEFIPGVFVRMKNLSELQRLAEKLDLGIQVNKLLRVLQVQ